MNKFTSASVLPLLATLALALPAGTAQADPWKNDGASATKSRERKPVFYADGCRIERRWERNGVVKEERRCRPQREYRREFERLQDFEPARAFEGAREGATRIRAEMSGR